jgi:hypothetical protein
MVYNVHSVNLFHKNIVLLPEGQTKPNVQPWKENTLNILQGENCNDNSKSYK